MSVWDDVVRVDQRGTYVACLAFARAMIARRRGSIVNIASVAGMRSMPLHAYAPAKAAVIAMTECLAAEWGPSGIRINAVSPGYTLTPALKNAIDRGERDVSSLTANAALRRLVDPKEIAQAVAFLASNAASAITGINIPVDCGWLAGTSWNTYGGLREAKGTNTCVEELDLENSVAGRIRLTDKLIEPPVLHASPASRVYVCAVVDAW
eukprot:gene61438-84041_t